MWFFERSKLREVVPVAVDNLVLFAKASLEIWVLKNCQSNPDAVKCWVTNMRQYNHIVSRQMNIGFNGMGSCLNGASERCHGVFWVLGFISSMRDSLRKLSPMLVFS